MPLDLKVSCINAKREFMPYRLTPQEADGLREIFSMYLPNGPIRKLVTYFKAGGGMPLYVGHSEYYDFDHVVGYMLNRPSIDTDFRNTMFGGGKGATIPSMMISGVAETFERALGAFAYFRNVDNIIYGTYNTLSQRGYKCLPPAETPLFAKEQYNSQLLYEPFTDDTLVGWLQGNRLVSGEEVWVPCQLVFPYYIMHPREVPIGYATTGGLACHINREEAIFHGVMELIERDCVNLFWNCKHAPSRIVFDRPPAPALQKLLDVARSLPVAFDFFLHTVDIPEAPVVTVIAFAEAFNRYSYYSGGGVGLSIDESVLYALTEYGQSEGTLRALLLAPDWELSKATRRLFDVPEDITVNEIDLFFKIISYYGYAKNAERMRWYVKDGPEVAMSSQPTSDATTTEQRYGAMMGILQRHEIDPIIFDFTPPQMSSLRLFKTYSSQLAPPYLQRVPLLGHRRYYEIPEKLGWADRRLRFEDLTTDPQPYP